MGGDTDLPRGLGQDLDTVLGRLQARAATVRPPPAAEDSDRRAAAQALAKSLGPRYAPDRARLEGFQVYHPDQAAVLKRLAALADALPGLVAGGGGIIFYGPVGTGKDHLLAAMLYRAASAGITCRWCNGQELYGQFRDGIDRGVREEDTIRPLVEPAVLAISDPIPPVGEPSAWNVAQMYRLLDRRYRALRSTWVSLNATSTEDADAKLSAPVFDRLCEGSEVIPCFWPSYRERARRGG